MIKPDQVTNKLTYPIQRKNITVVACILLCGFLSCTAQKEKGSLQQIKILDKEALVLLDPDAEIEVLAKGFVWTEGPLWIEEGQYLLFSDIPRNKVYKIDSKGDTAVYLKPSGYTSSEPREKELGSNGLLLDEQGNLILLQQGDRRVAKMAAPINDPKPNFITLTHSYQNKRLNSPNDGVFDREGNLYFTDPAYGLAKGMNDPEKELSFQGVYCLMNNDELILIDSLSRPNGIALSKDGSILYVAVSDPKHAVWYAYGICTPGKIDDKRIFYDVTHLVGKENPGLPDGMTIHSKGFIFAAGPGGIWLFNPSGKPVARIFTGHVASNCELSGDEKRLFITADDFILKLNLKQKRF